MSEFDLCPRYDILKSRRSSEMLKQENSNIARCETGLNSLTATSYFVRGFFMSGFFNGSMNYGMDKN